MNIEDFRLYCLSKKGVTEELPFDDNTLVFKVMGKIFAIADIEDFESFNVKCDPKIAVELREKHLEVTPGYHMNKKHWNTVNTHGSIPDALLQQWIDHSYDLVVAKLSHKDRNLLSSLD
ncbi:MAG: MmcQ/YjbR family DNA-binding protein [Cyclobacteriaceae bacterium]|nr:MmcQ/YjbR family DNA-binding protein [Cyclobacteriaceae bacterium]